MIVRLSRHAHATAYLAELGHELAVLDPANREEILADVDEYIESETARLGHPPSPAEIDVILAALGPPHAVAESGVALDEPRPATGRFGSARRAMAIGCTIFSATFIPALLIAPLTSLLVSSAAMLAALTGAIVDRDNRRLYLMGAAIAVVGLVFNVVLWWSLLPAETTVVGPSVVPGVPLDG